MLNVFLVIFAFSFMEFVAWFSHKYIMHGFLWKWHKDHHINDHSRKEGEVNKHFEKNDLFFLIYATPAIVLLIVGLFMHFGPLVAIGIGITIYGFTYFSIHDVAIHQRLPIAMFKILRGKYFVALLNAHQGHHRPKNKTDFDSYGLLIFPFRYLKSAKSKES
ncbi:MAG: sterol desaturase family protein [Prolixibacteraceae bacterium]